MAFPHVRSLGGRAPAPFEKGPGGLVYVKVFQYGGRLIRYDFEHHNAVVFDLIVWNDVRRNLG